MSSGGATGDDMNFVLGETFNFALAKDGNISLESGSLASEQNTGGDNNFTVVETLFTLKATNCYPNPVSDFLNIDLNTQNQNLTYKIYSSDGKLQEIKKTNVLIYDASRLATGNYFISIETSDNQILGVAKFIKK